MRRTPLVGTKVWFAPRRFGWGWAPASWEGWTVTLGTLPVFVFGSRVLHGGALSGLTIAAVLLLVIACALKGTSPGGSAELAHYRGRALPGDDPLARRLDDPSLEDINRRYDEWKSE